MEKIPVGILGATGAVGQRFVQLLAGHPWFAVTALAASDRTAGRPYGAACRWLLPAPMPAAARDLVVQPLEAELPCRLVFSALPGDVAGPVEERLAHAGYIVCSNASAHRLDPDVPLLIPEVNPEHTALLEQQRRRRGWAGLLVAAANCATTQLALALKPLHDAWGLRRVTVVTMQAVSGAGYPGVPALDILGNVLPYIDGEEEKLEQEPRRILGTLREGAVVPDPAVWSAQCNRVPVLEGHMACLSVAFARRPPLPEAVAALSAFRPPADVAALPSSPPQPIVVCAGDDRPQPARDLGAGMAVAVGRVRPCPAMHLKFVVLGHNTVRGAAGGAIHNAELLCQQGWIGGGR